MPTRSYTAGNTFLLSFICLIATFTFPILVFSFRADRTNSFFLRVKYFWISVIRLNKIHRAIGSKSSIFKIENHPCMCHRFTQVSTQMCPTQKQGINFEWLQLRYWSRQCRKHNSSASMFTTVRLSMGQLRILRE